MRRAYRRGPGSGWQFMGSRNHRVAGGLGLHAMSTSSGGYDPSRFPRLFELEDQSFWFRGRSDLINWALDRYFPKAQSLLEVGCGNGYVLTRIRQVHPDWQLVGTELHDVALTLARLRMPRGVELTQLDALNMAYSEEFDVAGAFDVIEHIEADEEVLAGLFRALRPGGGLILTVPQHKWLWSGADEAACHVRRYTREQLRERLMKAGFHVERVTSFVSLLLPGMIASRLVGREEVDVERELSLAGPLNMAAYTAMRLEGALIRRGVNFPVGGSLLAVARKPS